MNQTEKKCPDIQSGLIRIVYTAVPQSLFGILVCSFTLAVLQWGYIEHAIILTWFGIINALSIVRYLAYKKFSKDDSGHTVTRFWKNFAIFSAVASGITWGAVAIWLFPPDDVARQALVAFVIAGMCAGAVASLSPMMTSLTAFVLLATMPAVIRFLLLGTEVAYAMAFTSIIFVAIILKTAKNLNHTIKESLMMRHEQILDKEIIEHQAMYDSLTDLPNRRLLVEKLNHEVARAIRHKNIGAVLFLDLDYFKSINDSMGHICGDELLKCVANRLRSNLRDEDTVGRLGGDEFIILISNVGDNVEEADENIKIFTNKIMHLFVNKFDVGGQDIFITASIGVSMFPVSDAKPDELLQKSDVAMYEAKAAGRNKVRLFAPEMQQMIIKQRSVEKGLRNALLDNEFELFYQPLFNAEGEMFSVEALIRWNHPKKGLVPPVEFIELAEQRGLIIQIGDWVLEQACRDLVTISKYKSISMSINVSPRQFGESSFIKKLMKIISETGVNPKRITLEITESMIMENVEATIEKMNILTAEGIKFSIDDFGTGYSSLAYLKRLPVDLLKIDKSFVLDIIHDANDAVIVETILAMAQHMKIDVIAEGVETTEALTFLKEKGCRKFQGYLFERPMPFDNLLEIIDSGSDNQILQTMS